MLGQCSHTPARELGPELKVGLKHCALSAHKSARGGSNQATEVIDTVLWRTQMPAKDDVTVDVSADDCEVAVYSGELAGEATQDAGPRRLGLLQQFCGTFDNFFALIGARRAKRVLGRFRVSFGILHVNLDSLGKPWITGTELPGDKSLEACVAVLKRLLPNGFTRCRQCSQAECDRIHIAPRLRKA